MPEAILTFKEKVERTRDVASFRFIPESPLAFVPGQFLQVILDENDRKNRSLNKFLSFSSSPARPYIEVTKKNTGSAFCQRLWGLKPRDRVLASGPLGHCLLKPEDQKLCFLAGGIGITPVVSILEDMADKKCFHDTVLLYSNWEESNIPFRRELNAWQKVSPLLKVVHTLAGETPKDKNLLSGFITEELIFGRVPDFSSRSFFIFGPPAMVAAMQTTCEKLNIPVEKIYMERFAGYT